MPVASVNVGMELMGRRANAIADFWRSCAEIRQPAELMAVQLNFWTQLVDDYQECFTESMAQLSSASETATQAPPETTARSA
ncbi:hypothetical protein LJR219_001318 [Phenylobacterium sp. LjRoot219]|uniref:hypothetical protein n=1 Tax=Phenylobacterium sp. LjRoot219 TaxID=3342283 RepID=UPI003ECD172B